jgi:hypothetical protein
MANQHDYRAKLEWATEQLNTLNSELQAFVEKQPYRLITQFDTHTQENVVRVKVITPPPKEITGLVGNILADLRASLDHVAYALATKKGPLTNPKESSFPIVLDPMKWLVSGLPQIRHVEPAAQEAIKYLQPYHSVTPKNEPLALLDALTNVDKHRLPHEIRTVALRAEYVYESTQGGFVSVVTGIAPPGGFPNQAEIGRIRLPGNASDPQVDMRFRMPCEVCFDQGTVGGGPVATTLTDIQTRVWIALGKLSRFLS